MSNVLDDTKQQQILALGRLGWSLRSIEQALAVRRETISACPLNPENSKPLDAASSSRSAVAATAYRARSLISVIAC
jgi:hypothetical protein